MQVKHLLITLALTASTLVDAGAQSQSSATMTRRRPGNGAPRTRTEQSADAPQVTQRMQARLDADNATPSDADLQWMRVIYRELDLDKDKNAPLYFPEDIQDGNENLFRIIMRLMANSQIPVYEYLDGREDFSDDNRANVGEILNRFSIMHTDAKGSTAKALRYTIHPSDVPTNEVLSYYIIERWEFDTRNNRTRTIVEAICPVLHREGDFGGEAVRYPMFWVKYNDLRPWLAQQAVFTDDSNNLATASYDDFFTLNMYEGDIYKTRNLKNKSMAQLYPDPDKLQAARDSIDRQLKDYDKKLWVPDREEILAAKDKKSHSKTTDDAVSADSAQDLADQPADREEAVAKRATKRTAKKAKPKESKVKESKVKSSSSSNAVRSVRRRK